MEKQSYQKHHEIQSKQQNAQTLSSQMQSKLSIKECQKIIQSNQQKPQEQLLQINSKQQQQQKQQVAKKQNDEEDQQDNQQENQQENQNLQNEDSEQQPNSKWKKVQEPQKKVKLFMIDFAHCDAKKCSGKKLERFKLLTTLDKKKKFKGLVLSAFGKKQVCQQDIQYAQKYGVCVVDCSWNRIEQTRQFRFKHQRKLPFVTAGNPINYGKPYQLSCAEALATALCTIGYNDQAEYIMSKFGWADGFWSLNPAIDSYSKCKTLEQLKKQSKIIQETRNQSFQRNYDLSDPESSGDDN